MEWLLVGGYLASVATAWAIFAYVLWADGMDIRTGDAIFFALLSIGGPISIGSGLLVMGVLALERMDGPVIIRGRRP